MQKSTLSIHPFWQADTIEEVARRLSSHTADGLTVSEARTRLNQTGPNTLSAEEKEPFWKDFFEELREPMVLMLLVTGVLYALWGEASDAVTIFAIILTLNTVEVINEQRSKKAIASLRKLAEPTTSVRREGRLMEIPAEEVVPGDIVMLLAGHRVPADARLIDGYGLVADESALTGESVPVDKKAGLLFKPETPLAERQNMVYSSTLITRGRGSAMAVSTGMNTEIGRVAGMAREVQTPRTTLQQLMSELSRVLLWFALGFSALVPLIGIFIAHQEPKQMLLTGLSLAFATIPEELPIIITMVLSLGAFRLTQKHAIAKHLNAVESLGSVTVIATDKTGTLTENRMEVTKIVPQSSKNRLLEIGILCNDAGLNGTEFVGDAVDTALLIEGEKAGLDIHSLRGEYRLLTEFTFDTDRKRMSTVFQRNGTVHSMVKGAPESILEQSASFLENLMVHPMNISFRQDLLKQASAMAAEGLRVIALAERTLPEGIFQQDAAETELTFIGFIGLADPPRAEAHRSIELCRSAGIRTVMITGDHPLTARVIAEKVGFPGRDDVMTGPEIDRLDESELKDAVRRVSIFARTTPEHKLRIVQAFQGLGERVAVTGDGVNDAPALAAADIGVAMGKTGTDVAREASDLVLADDNFATIVSAVEEGRLIFENLKKGVSYYLACKLTLVLITLLPTLLLVPVPFAPVQIILMELFMDLIAAAAFSMEPAESDLLKQKPRDPKAKFMDGAMIVNICTSSLGLFISISVLYLLTWYGTKDQMVSQSVAFTAWLIGHVFLAFNMRSERQPLLQSGLGKNRLMLVWAAVVVVFLALANLIPGAQQVMKITSLSGLQWGMIVGAVFIGTFWMEGIKLIKLTK